MTHVNTTVPHGARPTFRHGDPEPARGTTAWLFWRDAQIFTLYAKEGAHQASTGRPATMLFRDRERLFWIAVTADAIDEDDIWEDAHGHRYRVTWDGAKQGPRFGVTAAERQRRLNYLAGPHPTRNWEAFCAANLALRDATTAEARAAAEGARAAALLAMEKCQGIAQ